MLVENQEEKLLCHKGDEFSFDFFEFEGHVRHPEGQMSKVNDVCRSEAQKRDLGSRRAGLPWQFLTQKWSGMFSAGGMPQGTSGPCIPSSQLSSDFSHSCGGQFRTRSASPSADSVPPQAPSLSFPFFTPPLCAQPVLKCHLEL